MTGDRLDPWGALLSRPAVSDVAADGPLTGRTFVAKDVFDVAGTVTGAGCPALRAMSSPATRSAAAVRALLAAGASYAGKARSDELAFSLSGVNALDGTPDNPAAPGHVTGGSSSGSAAAVAGELADIGLGTDTAGSIRVPASYCGLVGLRPTHGRVAVGGMVPLAPSYDTVGWLTRDGRLAAQVGAVLIDGWREAPPPQSFVVLDDLLGGDQSLLAAAAHWATVIGARLTHATLGDLERWNDGFGVLRSAEAWGVHGEWLARDRPAISPAVAQRLRAGADVTAAQIAAALPTRDALRARIDAMLPVGGALVVPAAPTRAPSLATTDEEWDTVRRKTLRLTTIAALAGAPSIAVPVTAPGLPLGLALIGRPGDDEALLAAAAARD